MTIVSFSPVFHRLTLIFIGSVFSYPYPDIEINNTHVLPIDTVYTSTSWSLSVRGFFSCLTPYVVW